MEIHFKSAHGKDIEKEITPAVTALAQRKILALKKLLNKGDHVAQVYVELGKVSEAHHTGNYWRTQINLDCIGQRYHADATADHIEGAIEKAVGELEAELRKAKERRGSLLRSGGAALKVLMRNGQADRSPKERDVA